ncbi:hypothetical protein HPC37_07335 [Pasteurellaceae bacterium 20609_3]|uniref:hypothetical protein n=1 Tax=Spirabiliibacterium mucosae TaxID=28156 RepID=UPI001AADA954|nr:hypothetical protein [Spirabiliibacterium mucosae]MBE2898615.1 hypothetical protein [Spirabiliibacterium mucosae]
MINLEVNKQDLQHFYDDVKLLALSSKQKKKILLWTVRAIKRNSQKNVRGQHTPDGQTWDPRKPRDGRVKTQKMLRRILRVATAEAEEQRYGRIRWKNPLTGEIARQQQEGFTEKITRKEILKNKKGGTNGLPATPQQAKRLRELGYRKRVGKTKNGKTKYKPYSISEIRQTLTRAWAGAAIRRLEKGDKRIDFRDSWTVRLPARPFLDVRDDENMKILTEFVNKFISGEYR